MMRRTRWWAAVIAVAALTGCVRVTVDTEITADDTFSQHSVLAFSPAVAEQVSGEAGFDVTTLFEELQDSPELADLQERFPGQVEVEPYDDGEISGIELTMTDLPLAELNAAGAAASGLGGATTVERVDDDFIVTMALGDQMPDLGSLGVTDSNISLLENSIEMGITYTFPGLVREANAGDIDGRSVTLGLGDLVRASEDVRIVADAQPGIDWAPLLRWGLIALAFVLVVGGAAALIVQDRRARRRSMLPAPLTGTAAGPGVLGAEAQSPADAGNDGDPEVRP